MAKGPGNRRIRASGTQAASKVLITKEKRLNDYEPVTLFRSPAAVSEGDCWF